MIVLTVLLACTWSVQGMRNVVYTRDGMVLCEECPSGTMTYTERRIITRPAQTYSPPYYNIQGRVVNNPSSLLSNDNTITQQTYYNTNDGETGTGTVDSNFINLSNVIFNPLIDLTWTSVKKFECLYNVDERGMLFR